jgi:hypothetical protein
MNREAVRQFITVNLGMRKFSAKTVPRILTNYQNQRRLHISSDLLHNAEMFDICSLYSRRDSSALKMEAIRFSETSVLTKTTRRQTQEDDFLHSHRRENLKSYDF